ncbi:uncharacterized protein [Lolium perenne]|uniref:uncharacterized protein n=1 Tax=Lolium perenne TaxID=4522 RepID=UPI003A98D3D7
MSNLLFSKKFLAKLTAIIRKFWWTGVQDDQTTRSLCLRAWADVCIDKNIGGLGIRNLQAINQGLILSAAWRLANEPHSQLAQILKAKYHPDTSIWRAKPNKPKSAFWSAILKVWRDKQLAPRVQTFAWRLLRKALPTGKRTSRKVSRPSQVYGAANAIIKGTNLEDNKSTHQQRHENTQWPIQMSSPISQAQHDDYFTENVIYCDAAWGTKTGEDNSRAGLGIIIHMHNNQHLRQLHVSALSPPASSPLQAETYGLLLATKLADLLQIQDPYFYTDSLVLALAAASPTLFNAPGHWENRPHLAAIQASPSFHRNKIANINRSRNIKADHQARLALRVKNASLAIRCLCPEAGQCPGKDILSVSSVDPFTLISVKCT